MLLWSCGKYLQAGLKSAKRYHLSCFCVEEMVVAGFLWSFFAAASSQRDVKKLRAEEFYSVAILSMGCLPLVGFAAQLCGDATGSVVLCREKSVGSTNLDCYSGFLCFLLTASHTKQSGGAEGDGPSRGAKVAACKTQVLKCQSPSTPTLCNEAFVTARIRGIFVLVWDDLHWALGLWNKSRTPFSSLETWKLCGTSTVT